MLYFDGYCPESLLKGKQVEMKLNEDDFYESLTTGLQVSIFPPHAAILRWRGKGKFRLSSDLASNLFTGLVLTETSKEDGKEIFPEEDAVLPDKPALEWYLGSIYKDVETFNENKFDPNDPVYGRQQLFLEKKSKREFEDLTLMLEYMKPVSDQAINGTEAAPFRIFEVIHAAGLIFPFNWITWYAGWKNIRDKSYNYDTSTLLELSMYLAAIFRADRFDDGLVEKYYHDGTIAKILTSLKKKVKNSFS